MSSKEIGLIEKYNVTRTDGKPIKRGCIVLEFDDPNAWLAIRVFADKVKRQGYTALWRDITNHLDKVQKEIGE